MKCSAAAAFAALAMLSSCAPTIRGEVDAAQGALTYYDYSTLPGSPTPVSMQLVMVVGPPGAVECGLPGQHQMGAPWRGAVDNDRSVTISLPSVYARRGGARAIRYQCRVVTDGHPGGQIVVRDIHDIEFPLDPAARERRFAGLRDLRRRSCAENELRMLMAGLTCDIERMEYAPQMSIQPYIVHVGDVDDAAPARWARLRERVAERCNVESEWMCRYLSDGTWEALQAADLERTNDLPRP